MRKVKRGIRKCGNVCGMVGKMQNANNLTAVALYAYNGLKNAVSIELRSLVSSTQQASTSTSTSCPSTSTSTSTELILSTSH